MVSKWTISLQDIPDDSTVEEYINDNTDIQDQIKKFSRDLKIPTYLKMPLNINIDELRKDTLYAIENNILYSFEYRDIKDKISGYQSASLTWNPDSIDKLSEDPHQSTLGSSMYSSGNALYYLKNKALKNTYADTFSFNERTPISKFKDVGKLLDSFKRTLIRSRISIYDGTVDTKNSNLLWHQDELIFYNLRVNIPVQSSSEYVIQIIKENPHDQFSVNLEEFELKPGYAYVYNTELAHRPFCNNRSKFKRINIICGISPWFDYHPEKKEWISNEFYGKMHPFDMFKQGFILNLKK